MDLSVWPIDFETRSTVDIKCGLDRYVEEADVFMLAYANPALGGTSLWSRGVRLDRSPPAPQDLLDHVAAGGLVSGWHIAFELVIWNKICVPQFGWPELKPEQCIDTMCVSQIHNLPADLDRASRVLGLGADKEKSKRGKYLIRRLCKPQKRSKAWPDGWVYDDALYAEFEEYCRQDVVAEDAFRRAMRPMTDHQRAVWLMTHRMNMRGVPLDRPSAKKLEQLRKDLLAEYNTELCEVTGGAVKTATNPQALKKWVNSRFQVDLDDEEDEDDEFESLAKDKLAEALARTDLPPDVRRALEIRKAAGQSSLSKIGKMLACTTEADPWIRGAFVAFGAGTGRWSSKGPGNFQNITRPTMKPQDITTAFALLDKYDGEELLFFWRLFFGERDMDMIVSCLRGLIAAPDGHTFLDADFSSVENRVASWIAGQHDKLDDFRNGLDEYKTFASTSLYGVPYDQVTAAQRQISKSAVLGSVFGQGWRGLIEFARGYGVHLTDEEAQHAVTSFRNSYPKVKQCWYACGNAAVRAVENPGKWQRVNDKLRMIVWKNFLWLELPSGRLVSWYAPRVEQRCMPWTEKVEIGEDEDGSPIYHEKPVLKPGVTVESIETKTRVFRRHDLIGSSIYQSAVQGTAADILFEGALEAEGLGFPPVLLAHDEDLVLIPQGTDKSAQLLGDILCRPRPWREDLPLSFEAKEIPRFEK